MWTKEYDQFISQAEGFPDGDTKIQLLESAANLAARHQDLEREFDAKLELMTAVTFGGQPEKMLVIFPWLLAQCDQTPEKYPVSSVMWTYKWVMEELPDFSNISRKQILSAMDDMEDRFRKQNYKERTIWEFRRILAMKFGDKVKAKEYQEKFEAAPEATFVDRLLGVANCDACELNNELDYFLFLGEEKKAIHKAFPILNGQKSCGEVPHNTYPKLLVPIYKYEDAQNARNLLTKGRNLIRGNKKLLKEHSELIQFATGIRKDAFAIEIMEEILPAALKSFNADGKFRIFLACANVLEIPLAEGRESIKLQMPAEIPVKPDPGSGAYPVRELQNWLKHEAESLAKSFDERNGNSLYQDMISANETFLTSVFPENWAARQ